MYEEANREKDSMVMKYAQAEHKNLEFQRQADRAEGKLRDMEKERDAFMVRMRAIKDHKTKISADLDAKVHCKCFKNLLCPRLISFRG